jgi:hypothetical protein
VVEPVVLVLELEQEVSRADSTLSCLVHLELADLELLHRLRIRGLPRRFTPPN